MSGLSKFLSRAALWFSAIGLIGMTAIIGWQVFARYVLNAAPSWTEQAALFQMLWFILFAAAAGVREGFHIRLSLLQDRLGGKRAQYLNILCHAIVFIFGAFMAWGGIQLVVATWHHTIPTLGLPRGSAYLPISIAGCLISFFSVEHVFAALNGEKVEPLWS